MTQTLLFFACLACNNKLSPDAAAPEAVPLEPTPAAVEVTPDVEDAAPGALGEASRDAARQGCAELDLWPCLDAADCTLELQGTEYICRDPADACEDGFVQRPPSYGGAEDQEDSCLAEPGCAFSGGACFCPQGSDVVLSCICGGGSPPYCTAE